MASRKQKTETPEAVETTTAEGTEQLNEATTDEATKTAEVDEVETPAETETPEAVETTTAEVEQEVKATKKTKTVVEIPAHVDKILKIYPNYAELYVDAKGGVFPKGTKPNLVANAILYQNPYYNKH